MKNAFKMKRLQYKHPQQTACALNKKTYIAYRTNTKVHRVQKKLYQF